MKDHPEDWKAGVKINLYDESNQTRFSSEISQETLEGWQKIIDRCGGHEHPVFKTNCILAGTMMIWLTGFMEYVGPPERHPDLKYQIYE